MLGVSKSKDEQLFREVGKHPRILRGKIEMRASYDEEESSVSCVPHEGASCEHTVRPVSSQFTVPLRMRENQSVTIV